MLRLINCNKLKAQLPFNLGALLQLYDCLIGPNCTCQLLHSLCKPLKVSGTEGALPQTVKNL